MTYGPVEGCLNEILGQDASDHLILVVGAAILVKRRWLERTRAKTLIEAVPLAKTTEDIDFLLKLELFVHRGEGEQVRAMLDALNYIPKEQFWQFQKGDVIVDFLARIPENMKRVKCDNLRVGASPTIHLHRRSTLEAFAVELSPVAIEVPLSNPDQTEIATAHVAHPYGLINMKTRAAHDWLQRRVNGEAHKPFSETHALDVYILVASLTLAELDECRELARVHDDHAVACAIREEAKALFSRENAPGFVEANRQARMELDHPVFWDALREALGSSAGTSKL